MWSALLEPLYPDWQSRPPDADGDWVPLDRLATLAFSGARRNEFLQGYFTRNLDDLQPGHALYGATCDIQGRITCNGWLFAEGERTLYRISADLVDLTRDALAKYAVFSRTGIELAGWLGAGLMGARAEALGDAPVGSARAHAGGVLVRVYGHAPRYELWLPPEAAATWTNSLGAPPAPPDAWLREEIAAGVATVTAKTTGRYIPQQLGMNELKAIDFDKGCYLGQEIIARLQYRGTAKRSLGRLVSSERSAGSTLYAGDKKAGEIVACAHAASGSVALAVLTGDLPELLRDELGIAWRRAHA